jgi:hypothetical protein
MVARNGFAPCDATAKTRAFGPVFQPILDLEKGRGRGYGAGVAAAACPAVALPSALATTRMNRSESGAAIWTLT